MRSSTCNGNALFIEIKLCALYNIPNENKGLICGGVMRGETSTPPAWISSEIAYLK